MFIRKITASSSVTFSNPHVAGESHTHGVTITADVEAKENHTAATRALNGHAAELCDAFRIQQLRWFDFRNQIDGLQNEIRTHESALEGVKEELAVLERKNPLNPGEADWRDAKRDKLNLQAAEIGKNIGELRAKLEALMTPPKPTPAPSPAPAA